MLLNDGRLISTSLFAAQLANSHGVLRLGLTDEEKARIKAEFTRLLEQLHRAGYVHCDVFERNLCLRRVSTGAQSAQSFAPSTASSATSAPLSTRAITGARQSRLHCRLIDLSAAEALGAMSQTRQASTRAHDHKELSEVFDRLDAEHSW